MNRGKNSGEPGRESLPYIPRLLLVEPGDVVLEAVDAGADREGDPDRGDDRLAPVEGLDLDLHPAQVLLGGPHDDLPVAPVAEAHHHERVDLGEDLRVHVLRLLGDDAETDPELPPFHRALAE